jgi:hypothetical protein
MEGTHMMPNFAFDPIARAPIAPLLPFRPGEAMDVDELKRLYRPVEPNLGLVRDRETQTAREPTSVVTTVSTDRLRGALFDAQALANVIAAQLSMHLEPEWRDRTHKQIERLLDPDQWEAGDKPLDAGSMRTFLRFAIYAGVKAVPSLGMSPAGNLLAAWRRDTRRLTMEFQPLDKCRLVISHVSGDDASILTFMGLVTAAWPFLEREAFSLG